MVQETIGLAANFSMSLRKINKEGNVNKPFEPSLLALSGTLSGTLTIKIAQNRLLYNYQFSYPLTQCITSIFSWPFVQAKIPSLAGCACFSPPVQ
jgi:hypothetical protein